jgi:hypothetical protein
MTKSTIPRTRSPSVGVTVNGLLENGYFKLFGLVVGLCAYFWQGATWKTSVEMHADADRKDTQNKYDMVSYQIAEMDKRLSATIA